MHPGLFGLPLRSAVIARRRRQIHILASIAAVAVVAFLGAVGYEAWPHRANLAADISGAFTSPATAEVTLAALPAPSRPVYRHSIVPGGAYSPAEVADALRKDAVVAAHYADVDVDKVRVTTVTAARAVYVSYRVADKVYWTKNRVRLSAGETLLTDGDTEIRARCGNLVSDQARQPVAGEDPAPGVLDQTGPETGSSTIAGERGAEGRLSHVPDLPALARSLASDGLGDRTGWGASGHAAMWAAGGNPGMSFYSGASAGTGVAGALGTSGRTNRDEPNGGGSSGGGSNGGGSNGGGSNNGGSDEKVASFVPPTTDDIDPTTTTGGAVTTTTGYPGIDSETTGGGGRIGDAPAVPEPGTLALLGLAAVGAAARAMRARRH